jgi:hypothetical protein
VSVVAMSVAEQKILVVEAAEKFSATKKSRLNRR